MKKVIFQLLFASVGFLGCSSSLALDKDLGNDNIEKPSDKENNDNENSILPLWQEGELLIHAINTGRGECMFYILPDGTTMLVDAAGSLLETDPKSMPTAPKPNSSITSGKVIADYIRHFIPVKSGGKLDYFLLTHYHEDHMGSVSKTKSDKGDFYDMSMSEVASAFHIKTFIDRDYPSFDTPTELDMDNNKMRNYKKFLEWTKTANGTKVERFVVGSDNQFILNFEATRYPDFSIRNIAANGQVWTGNGLEYSSEIPPRESFASLSADALPPENILSCVFMLHYGKFDYFAGGDIQYNGRSSYAWRDIEAPVAEVVSDVEVMKACHHGTSNCNSDALLRKLNPEVMIANVWRDVQPNPATMDRMWGINGRCDIFTTNFADKNKQIFGTELSKFKSTGGHIVVKVVNQGAEYYVFVLDDNDQEYKVKSTYGPYKAQ